MAWVAAERVSGPLCRASQRLAHVAIAFSQSVAGASFRSGERIAGMVSGEHQCCVGAPVAERERVRGGAAAGEAPVDGCTAACNNALFGTPSGIGPRDVCRGKPLETGGAHCGEVAA